MTDENETVNESTDTAETAQEAPQTDEETTAGTEGTPEDSSATEGDSDLPAWAQDKLSKANKEAARYRTQLREAQDALSKAAKVEDLEALRAQLAQAERKNLVAEVASETGVPASLLHGDTEEELRETAQALKDFMSANTTPRATRTPSDPAGGLDPSDDEEDYAAQAKAYAQSLRANRF